ncbi:TrbC/VirB2 family protein [Variovorax sp. YR216]|uniref:TrbC/VirB2 family protein n=1 Tax=Variovorax sp. YR216 TaxID=1882828 RepID=UPI0008946D26|nr:TrbC/VirB2 family protein [Variovorax sp. YR216]SEB26334.1 type IV secretion system protein VirB2 [Variovorax sp. YR216]
MNNETALLKNTDAAPAASNERDKATELAINALVFGILLLPGLASAQTADASGLFGGLTSILKSVVNLLIYEWGYYIGIITLAIQGYRWKTGRIDLMTLGGWGFGIALVFFAPNLVGSIRSAASGSVG